MSNLLFFSHAGKDTILAERMVKLIEDSPVARENGLEVWFDKKSLVPGGQWQVQIEDAILSDSTAFVVLLGSKGVVNWVDSEVRLALIRAISDSTYRFIPIVLDQSDFQWLPGFARLFQGVGNIESTPEELEKLLNAVLGFSLNKKVNGVANPYKGLSSFNTADTHLFFGREEETSELLSKLGKNDIVMVVGDSGSGKSSLVKAGVIAQYLGGGLADQHSNERFDSVWAVIQTRPQKTPFGTLADSLEVVAHSFGLDSEAVDDIKTKAREKSIAAAYDAIVKAVPGVSEVLLFVDQFEEVFTNCSILDREKYINMLTGLAKEPGNLKVRIVLTMRRDYYNLCAKFPDFFEYAKAGYFLVRRMHRDQLEDCIRKPLRFTDVKDDENFAKTVVMDVGDSAGELVLMQLAVTKAWEQKEKYPSLTDSYVATGRVTGALAKLADEILGMLDDHERDLVDPLLIRLVHLGDTTEPTRRLVARQELSDESWKLAQKLASERNGGRLLVITQEGDEIDESEPDGTVELIHESLITQWHYYNHLLHSDDRVAHHKRLHDEVIIDSGKWQQSGCKEKSEFFLRGGALESAIKLIDSHGDWLSDVEREFVLESKRSSLRKKRRERVKNLSILIFGVVSSVLAAVSLWFYVEQKKVEYDLLGAIEKNADLMSLMVTKLVENSGMTDSAKIKFLDGVLMEVKHTDDPASQRFWAIGKIKLADLFAKDSTQGGVDTAIDNWNEGFAVLEALIDKSPDDTQLLNDIAFSYIYRGGIFTRWKNYKEAEKSYEISLQVQEGLISDAESEGNELYVHTKSLLSKVRSRFEAPKEVDKPVDGIGSVKM